MWRVVVVGVLLLAGGVGAIFWRRHRARQRSRLISFVALLREPAQFDPTVLASVAGRVWDADLGDGESEGTDGFTVSSAPIHTIMHNGQFFMINCFPMPYVEEPEAAADQIGDLRIRGLFREHRAWFSCDAMGIDGQTPDDEVIACYCKLALLFAELLDENCVLIFLPDTSEAYPINEETEEALRSADPIAALRDTMSLPIIEISDDDPLMRQAVEKARESWPSFVAAFETQAGENFSVKAPVRYEDLMEYIWIAVRALEAGRIYGELGNDPGNLGPLKFGSKVVVPLEELNDWAYVDRDGNFQGGFTIEAVKQAARRRRKR